MTKPFKPTRLASAWVYRGLSACALMHWVMHGGDLSHINTP
ncbi:DUF2933 domain-containing protein [Phormidium pseudopriestleyi FRX01]|uniref:DUF2933 domain-containing protein n=1 Tax=Phormidium pseudopriestleyi FRX01 TaxID=1759528 RepID=A0ABS3FRM1_9CYAN|nr:DUF2933 domain-containing protein [Phormidium pseudopriestleyi FRX01]